MPEQRTYRACLHCRARKSKCDLDSTGVPGDPPCRRCMRERRQCIISLPRGEAPRPEYDAARSSGRDDEGTRRPTADGLFLRERPRDTTRDGPMPPPLASPHSQHSRHAVTSQVPQAQSRTPTEALHADDIDIDSTIDDAVTSGELQNPSDALNLLSRVAEYAREGQTPEGQPMHLRAGSTSGRAPQLQRHGSSARRNLVGEYALVQAGALTEQVVRTLLDRYMNHFHPFFPIANERVLAMQDEDPSSAYKVEPHLLTAVLIIAAKGEANFSNAFSVCSKYMERLIATMIYTGPPEVEAVEAMLLLSEWAPQGGEVAAGNIGKGEEDRGAWMQVGLAVRMGYLQSLEQIPPRSPQPGRLQEDLRRQVAWAACYMCDRQISIRVGKAFWSRGPGFMNSPNLYAYDLFKFSPGGHDDHAGIFQANLDLTQLFSNAHDVLYASRSHRDRLFLSGEYVKYIDDFRTAISNWHGRWGSLSCSPKLKSSLIVSYEYLRLYVNAFAYQATLSRVITENRVGGARNGHHKETSLFAMVASTPDARFIYEAVDAAKLLLSTFNSFIDPVHCLRHMPVKYSMYIIYSACFLYKAKATGVLRNDDGNNLRIMIHQTIDRLQKSSCELNDLGDRYSRLLRLLWRNPPKPARDHASHGAAQQQHGAGASSITDAAIQNAADGTSDATWNGLYDQIPLNTFSWRDLGAIGQFATNNNSDIDDSAQDGGVMFAGDKAGDAFAWLNMDTEQDLGMPLDFSMPIF